MTSFRSLSKLDLDFFRQLEALEPENKVHKGDIMDGLIVAMDMLLQFTGKRKYKRRIFLITDGEKETKFDKTELNTIVSNMNETDTKLNVITLDFCNDLEDEDEDEDEREGDKQMKAKDKNSSETKAQLKNGEFLQNLVQKVKGAIFPASVAI